eukprot:6457371-Amphidinium_carterae.1
MSVHDDGYEDLSVTVRKAVRFWTCSEATLQLYVFRTALLPQQMLMLKIIDNSKGWWDLLQCTAQMRGERPQYRAEVFHSCAWCYEALAEGATNLSNERIWVGLSPTKCTASFIFRSVARVQASIYDLIILRCRGYPLKLTRLICHTRDRDEELASFLSTPKCALDDFSLYLQQRLRDSANTNTVLQQLRVSLEWLACTTYGCERLHAQNLRKVLSKTMTTRVDAAQVAAVHMGGSAPTNFQ